MPYRTKDELPENVQSTLKNLPHALDVYKEAYNNAYEHYADPEKRKESSSREETAHAVAWSAVKEQYEKDEDGNWRSKEQH